MWCILHLYLYLFPAETVEIAQQRANYFIIKGPLAVKTTIGARGTIYVENQEESIGTFKVIDVDAAGNEYLCVVDSIRPGVNIDSTRFHRAAFETNQKTQHNKKREIYLNLTVNHKRLRFKRLIDYDDGKYYLSEKAIPIKTIEPMNTTGIKNLLYKIETDVQQQFSANLINFAQIQPLGLAKIIDFADKNKIFLGTVEGNLSMIYDENGVLQSTRISSDTLKKFKDDMVFHVVLEKRYKGKKEK
ncbi:MAG: hypothetical protein GTO45_18410 [Candidatus Aminicenantes bacterium]|nr:hypothetical protein [Candidatus Aminicenantes bacterium]NIM80762.1 hypothetical protein [Candidatus Aminicenantes bacterium]NIN20145.1 hypothetical protein [Candidatus Aminicenantes bacterium]NIN43924.1 hypothetical protein [Candidatus Aminicenantes bacterium]NIN86733.1 hypothetical protein [Candidatus Aminicenantes bacterium]